MAERNNVATWLQKFGYYWKLTSIPPMHTVATAMTQRMMRLGSNKGLFGLYKLEYLGDPIFWRTEFHVDDDTYPDKRNILKNFTQLL